MALSYTLTFENAEIFAPQTPNGANPALARLADGGFLVLADDGGSITAGEYRGPAAEDGTDTGTMGGSDPAAAQISGGNVAVATTHLGEVTYRVINGTGGFPVPGQGIGDAGSANPAITALQGGGFAIVYEDVIVPGLSSSIEMRLYSDAGVEQRLSTVETTAVINRNAAVAQRADGTILIAWEREDGPGVTSIYTALYDSSGFVLRAATALDQFGTINARPQVVATAEGFAVFYEDNGWGTGGTDITLARLSPDGTLIDYVNVTNPAFLPSMANETDVSAVGLADGYLAVSYTDTVNPDTDVTLIALYQDGTRRSFQTALNGTSSILADQFDGVITAAGVSGIAGLVDSDDAGIRGERTDLRVNVFSDAAADLILAGVLFETFQGGAGDTVSYQTSGGGVRVDLATGLGSRGTAEGDFYLGINNVIGSGLNDLITGNGQTNSLSGGAGLDTLFGGAGTDILNGGLGIDVMEGGLGNDQYLVDSLGDVVAGEVAFGSGGGIDTVTTSVDFTAPVNVEILRALAGVAGVDLTGNDAPGTLVGNELANVLNGRGGNDQLNGNAGDDVLTGGEGADTLVGGTGADQFIFNAVSNSRAGAASRDVINGFDRGAVQDRIDLSAIDANTATAANDAFTFIGTGAFTAAGQVRIQSLGGPNAVIVEINVNADLAADMQIFVNLQTTMGLGDFLL
jgi:Ca2+-binding RTX toxin-like protein